jgi:recombinational DNA repair protein (RecF pathway)
MSTHCADCGTPLPPHGQNPDPKIDNLCDNCWEVGRRLKRMRAAVIEKILRQVGFQARVMGRC